MNENEVRMDERRRVLAELNLPYWDPLLSATGDAGEWVKRQVADEREACARVADKYRNTVAARIAREIRALSPAPEAKP